MTKIIILTKGFVTFVDDEDYERLNKWRWYAQQRNDGKYIAAHKLKKIIRMHRLILNAPAELQVDHIDGNPLNNCRSNLRLCTAKENQRNARKRGVSSSKYKGVSWDKERNKWKVQIRINDINKMCGRYASEIEAAEKYNTLALTHFGEFARLNEIFPIR